MKVFKLNQKKKDYLKQVERFRNKDIQEKATQSFLENNRYPSDVITTIQKIYKPNQIAYYYAGGLSALTSLLTDSKQFYVLYKGH
jgi:hypothetical protein